MVLTPAKRYGQRFLISLIPGDGVGKEVCGAVQKVFDAAKVPIDWDEVLVSGHDDRPANQSGLEGRLGTVLESLRRNRVGLKGINAQLIFVGTFYTPKAGHLSFNLAIRKALSLYANVVHVRSLPGIPTRHGSDMDIVLIRENTEGEYAQLEHEPAPGIVESLKVVTRAGSEAITRFAFDYAIQHGRKKITCVNKANIMKLTDGEFLRAFRDVSADYSHASLHLDEMIVDNAAMQMVSRPSQFDVIVTPNLYGNILGNIGAALVRSAGLLPGYSLGPDCITFEPGARHVGMDIEGKDVANPISMLLSGVLMLRHLGLKDHADSIERAIYATTKAGTLTRDIPGGRARTSEFTDAVIRAYRQQ